jgi:hypothetical protein
MLGDKRLPLDEYFVAGMRERLDCAKMIDRLIDLTARLTACGKGELALSKGEIEASKAALVGIKIALAKVVPDLQTTTLKAGEGSGVTIEIVKFERSTANPSARLDS